MLHARSTKRNRAVQKVSKVPGEQELLIWSYGNYGRYTYVRTLCYSSLGSLGPYGRPSDLDSNRGPSQSLKGSAMTSPRASS
jgi:hypothetical protein